MSKNIKIINYHIGGRAGSIGFPINKKFKHEIYSIIFEADIDCLDQIKEKNINSEVKGIFVGANNKNIEFNINYCPYTSSVYLLNEKYESYFHKNSRNTDYLFKNVMKPMKKVNLKTRSLDSLINNKEILPADFISLDVQGGEYEILYNAQNLLKENILAISCEVSFAELYKDAKLFSDINKLLIENGFFIVDLNPMNIGCERIPSNFRGKGIPLQGEILYFKDLSYFRNDNLLDQIKLRKLAFIAISFGYTEYAYKLIKKLNQIKVQNCDYSNFLEVFYNKINQQMNNLPKLWDQEFSFENSLSRFSNKKKERVYNIANLKSFLKKVFQYYLRRIRKYNSKSLSFSKFLKDNGFDIASKENSERINNEYNTY